MTTINHVSEIKSPGKCKWLETSHGRIVPLNSKFVACSGAQLVAAAKGDPENGQRDAQLNNVGSQHLLTMELGGNNCHFSDIARACVYVGHAAAGDGKEYPNPDGDCYKAITKWEEYILSDSRLSKGSLFSDHFQSLWDILAWSTIKGRDDFYLYIVGYAEFFNISPSSDWCNGQTFGKIRKPRLSNALRSKMNELVRNVNSKNRRVCHRDA